jgi:hypothetical protein
MERSYVTLDEAEEYFSGRLNADAWNEANTLDKEKSLITASGVMDTFQYSGVAVSDSQPRAFPRTGSYYSSRLGKDVIYPVEGAPLEIKNATCEMSLHLFNNEDLLNETSSVDELVVGKIELKGLKDSEKFPSSIYDSIKYLVLSGGGGNSWWRAN